MHDIPEDGEDNEVYNRTEGVERSFLSARFFQKTRRLPKPNDGGDFGKIWSRERERERDRERESLPKIVVFEFLAPLPLRTSEQPPKKTIAPLCAYPTLFVYGVPCYLSILERMHTLLLYAWW